MAASLALESTQEVFPWLKSLPLAPEYHPTLQEFQDPISYIFKIEKEASKYGICKIVPPVPPSPKKTVIANLNRSLAARNGCSDSSNFKSQPTFTTRQQQIGFCPRKPRPVQRPVWQSGEYYTFQQFEAKAKSFEKSLLRKCAKKGGLSPLETETLYWKATVDKPFSVEYANDMPGSAFVPVNAKKIKEAGEGVTLGETAWNMRAISRSKGSLLRFMKEEIPGVTSPMVYVAMVFSWFAWHVEDHDLHSLNYLHMGAGKTWYGVPREAAVAFEEVVRIHGYGGEINPLVTFSTLGEKTTVISPEVFIKAGIPCCRLVQNAGEFVVTFPRAYHTGFSHGFNCGEASNIVTPEWLLVAKDAAIRRASINYPPMVSHFQLLYDLALDLCSRVPKSISIEPRSSRLKEKKKDEGETLVKELFVQNVMQNNDLLHALGKGSSVVLLPWSSSDLSACSKLRVGSQLRGNPRLPLGLTNLAEETNSSRSKVSDGLMINRNQEGRQVKGFYSMKGKLASLSERSQVTTLCGNSNVLNSRTLSLNIERRSAADYDVLSEQRLFSCVTCGILNFACFAIVQPSEEAARYLISADCSFLNDWVAGSGVASNAAPLDNGDSICSEKNNFAGWKQKDAPVLTTEYQVDMADKSNEGTSNAETCTSALCLLALNYGNSSDSDSDQDELDGPVCGSDIHHDASGHQEISLARLHSGDEFSFEDADCNTENGHTSDDFKDSSDQKFDCYVKSNTLVGKFRDPKNISHPCSPDSYDSELTKFGKAILPNKNANVQLGPLCDEESSRMHVFCLEHAVEVEQQLRQIGGVHIFLLCHPDYPNVEAKAKVMAEELEVNHPWNHVIFRDATKDDEERIQLALDSEEVIPKNGDWAVKLGINLFYSANLSHSPLYSKQMPYNSVIYNVFGRSSPANSPTRTDGSGRSRRQKKIVAGKWCGKVWMSNQVHLFLKRHPEDDGEEQRSVRERAVLDEKPETMSDCTPKDENNMTARKYVRKRRMTVESEVTNIAKCVEKEEPISDNSIDDFSHQQNKRFVRRKQNMGFDVGSSKKVKHIETEAAFSDDSMDDGSCWQRERIAGNRWSKYIGRDDIVSDDSLGVDSDQQHNSNPRSKKSKHTGKGDMISDDYLDSNYRQLYGRITSRKQAKQLEREDSVSDDACEDNSCKQFKTIHKNKQAKLVEREEDDSDELVEESPLQQHKRVLRSKQKRVMTQQKMKQENIHVAKQTTRPGKQGSRRLAKQDIHQKGRQPPRRQSNLCEQASESDDEEELDGPRTRLRKRSCQSMEVPAAKCKEQQQTKKKNVKSASAVKVRSVKNDANLNEAEYSCDIEGCTMSFGTKQELVMHKKNICPVKSCGKKFFSHKYLLQHRRVHMDDRPLRCPWKGCKMTFKWAWARTEHIRVHTGARPYVCAEPGCGQTFRFVSDFSRHKRKTGHSVKKNRR